MIYVAVLLVLIVAGLGFVYYALAKTIDHAHNDPCAMWCQYSQDVGMYEYSCARGCYYRQMGRQ